MDAEILHMIKSLGDHFDVPERERPAFTETILSFRGARVRLRVARWLGRAKMGNAAGTILANTRGVRREILRCQRKPATTPRRRGQGRADADRPAEFTAMAYAAEWLPHAPPRMIETRS